MAATVFGVADFLGGTAARRLNPILVTVLAQLAGFGALLAIALLAFSAHWLPGALLWGLLAGVAGGLGLPMLYRSLAIGPMNVVAPLTALTSSVVPVLVGVLFGERPSPLAWLGIGLAVIAGAVVGMSSAPAADDAELLDDAANGDAANGDAAKGVLFAVLSGFCFGGFYVLLSLADPRAGIWPVTAARFAGCLVAGGVLLLALRGGLGTESIAGTLSWVGWRLAAIGGVLDASANALYLLAVQRGSLAVVGSIMGLYPASTVLLARYLHGERIGPMQRFGLLLAVPAMVLVGGG
jgi:drug/metabolite transporter (DMT)-like permease